MVWHRQPMYITEGVLKMKRLQKLHFTHLPSEAVMYTAESSITLFLDSWDEVARVFWELGSESQNDTSLLSGSLTRESLSSTIFFSVVCTSVTCCSCSPVALMEDNCTASLVVLFFPDAAFTRETVDRERFSFGTFLVSPFLPSLSFFSMACKVTKDNLRWERGSEVL